MTLADDAATTERATTLSLDFDFRHPPAKVWRALTDPALMSEWLLPVIGPELRLGEAFTLRTQPYPGWDGTVACRVLEIEPYRRLSYTWTVPFLDTVVTFTLVPVESGTRLTVVQSGFAPAQRRELGGARYGWTRMGGQLADLLARIA